jgi:D-beta-D-heptose 7-phosphate kinase/D-beta-D-heptose 1-phosphate adenosyltransferase
MFRVDEDKISTADISQIEFPEETKYVILSDYNKGVLSKSQQLIHKLKQQGKIVIVDPKKSLVNYEGADIIKMNEEEYHKFAMVGDSYQDTRKFYNVGTFVITRGSKGPIIVEEGRIIKLEGIDKEVADVTGAGDVFIAAMTYYLAKGEDIHKACVKANKLAALSVSHFGTYTLTPEDIRTVEKKIVFTNGCFDVIHKGHIEYLQKSKELGDYLIVGLNSDDSVRRRKGNDRPFNKQEDRKLILESLSCVNEVIIFEEDSPYELIKKVNPDIITKGGDYVSKTYDVNGRPVDTTIIPYVEGFSTTNILEYLNGHC